jgi:hypothetical protein
MASIKRGLQRLLRGFTEPNLHTFEESSRYVQDFVVAVSGEAATASESLLASTGVPTEFLQGDLSTPLELPAERPRDGPLIRRIVHRPVCCVTMVWAVSLLTAVVLFAVGELNFSAQETLFVNSNDEDVSCPDRSLSSSDDALTRAASDDALTRAVRARNRYCGPLLRGAHTIFRTDTWQCTAIRGLGDSKSPRVVDLRHRQGN